MARAAAEREAALVAKLGAERERADNLEAALRQQPRGTEACPRCGGRPASPLAAGTDQAANETSENAVAVVPAVAAATASTPQPEAMARRRTRRRSRAPRAVCTDEKGGAQPVGRGGAVAREMGTEGTPPRPESRSKLKRQSQHAQSVRPPQLQRQRQRQRRRQGAAGPQKGAPLAGKPSLHPISNGKASFGMLPQIHAGDHLVSDGAMRFVKPGRNQ